MKKEEGTSFSSIINSNIILMNYKVEEDEVGRTCDMNGGRRGTCIG
jgi:hypothetical protein